MIIITVDRLDLQMNQGALRCRRAKKIYEDTVNDEEEMWLAIGALDVREGKRLACNLGINVRDGKWLVIWAVKVRLDY